MIVEEQAKSQQPAATLEAKLQPKDVGYSPPPFVNYRC